MRLAAALLVVLAARAEAGVSQPEIGARVVRVLQVDGLLFKDLNKNGTLDAYEDWRRPVEERVADLVSQMTLEEKAGMMVGPSLELGPGGSVNEQPIWRSNPFSGGPPQLYAPGTSDAIQRRHITQFINRANTDARTMATWLNAVQAIAEGTRLGIPAFFVTNPRNHLSGAAQFGINEAAGTSRSGREHSASRRRAMRRSWRSSRRSRPASMWRSASAARTTRRPTSPPSLAGAASTGPSARTARSRPS